jgi:hypothetical protein
MDIKFSVLLYSKYSKFSKELIDMIEKSSVDFITNFKLKLLCIDNEDIRKKIANSKQIDIKSVPSLLIVYNDGGIEKYEDSKVFNWFENIIVQLLPPPPGKQELPPQKIEDPIEEIEEEIIKPKKKKKINKPNLSPPPSKKQSKSTPIDELETEDEDEDIQLSLSDENRNDYIQIESGNALVEKRNDLMSIASSMQQSRDSFVEKTEKKSRTNYSRDN